jgi:hypothetical protein
LGHREDVKQEAERLRVQGVAIAETSRAAYRMYRDYGYARVRRGQRPPPKFKRMGRCDRVVASEAGMVEVAVAASDIGKRAGEVVELLRQGYDRGGAARALGISYSRVLQVLADVKAALA